LARYEAEPLADIRQGHGLCDHEKRGDAGERVLDFRTVFDLLKGSSGE
jgi:hypothetical protein